MAFRLGTTGSLAGGVLAAIGASVCCVAPLVLLSFGLGGAWVVYLTRFEPVRPVFIGLTFLFLALAFRRLYLIPQACAPGHACADPRVRERQRALFWTVGALLVGLIAVPWVAPLFY